jgi:hypothetical protein
MQTRRHFVDGSASQWDMKIHQSVIERMESGQDPILGKKSIEQARTPGGAYVPYQFREPHTLDLKQFVATEEAYFVNPVSASNNR